MKSAIEIPKGSIISRVPYVSNGLRDWMQMFLYSCRSRNLAKGTIDFYNKKLGVFLKFCSDLAITNISDVTADNIRQFLIFLDEKGHKPAGIHCYYRSVKTFLNWYEREAEPDGWRNPINKVKAPIVPLEPLDSVSIETIRAMVGTCNRGWFTDARDKALLLVLLDTGMRLEETLSLNREDVDPINGTILVRSGKGRKPRNVYLGEKARLTVKRYLKQRNDHNPALWISILGSRLTGNGLRMMLRRRAAQADVPVPSPHDFRRAFAIERWRAGVDILTLSKLMGHTSLQVLNRYLKQAGEDLALAAKTSSPVDLNF